MRKEIVVRVAEIDATIAEIDAAVADGLIVEGDHLLVTRAELVALKFALAFDAAGRDADTDVMLSRVKASRE